MAHRAWQILEAVKAELVASTAFGDRVYIQRTLSLSEKEQELPAACVFFGEDEALSEQGNDNVAFIDSLQAVKITLVYQASTEEELTSLLLNQGVSAAHIVMLSNPTHGLAFISGTRYRGRGEPEINTDGARVAGSLETRWAVDYRMNINDPN